MQIKLIKISLPQLFTVSSVVGQFVIVVQGNKFLLSLRGAEGDEAISH